MTMQIRDRITYNGNEYRLSPNLCLERFVRGKFQIPPMTYGEYTMVTTACNRGYVAVFEIKDNALYIKTMNNESVDKPLDYTGILDLISDYEFVEVKNRTNIAFEMIEKIALSLEIKDGKLLKTITH